MVLDQRVRWVHRKDSAPLGVSEPLGGAALDGPNANPARSRRVCLYCCCL